MCSNGRMKWAVRTVAGAAACLVAAAGWAQQAAAAPPPQTAAQAAARVALDNAYPAPQGDAMGGRGFGGTATPRNMKTVLIWADTRNGIAQHDSTSHAAAVIEELGYRTGAYYSYIRTD